MSSQSPTKKVEEEHSASELFSSARLLAKTAQSASKGGGADKVDKAKVADAAGDLLDAAGKYGKLDDQKGIGQYVDKAADYLHQYQHQHSPNDTTAVHPPSSEHPPKHDESKGEGAHSGGHGGGIGDNLSKLAGGFFNK